MSKKEIEKKVINEINEVLKENKQKVNVTEDGKWKEAQFNADLGFDSLKTVELFMECERVFNVKFTDEEIFKADTIGKMIEKINEKLGV